MCLVIRSDAYLADTDLAFNAEKPRHLSLVILLRTKELPLYQGFVVLRLELFDWRHLFLGPSVRFVNS